MVSLHQLRCFAATLEHGSFTAAAARLGYAQPSISEQVRLLEQQLGVVLFHRAGRGVVPTQAAWALRPHAAAALAAVEEGVRAVTSVREVIGGTVRFGIFKIAHYYLGADLVSDVLERYPGIRLELVGLNSADNIDRLRRGTLEAALVALPLDSEGLAVEVVMRDELVYVSAHPERLREPVSGRALAVAPLVLPDVSRREHDSTRQQLTMAAQAAGGVLRPKAEVEDIETALETAARGVVDTVCWHGMLQLIAGRLPPGLGWVSLDPPLHERFGIAHRPGVELSPATRVVLDLAIARMRELDLALNG